MPPFVKMNPYFIHSITQLHRILHDVNILNFIANIPGGTEQIFKQVLPGDTLNYRLIAWSVQRFYRDLSLCSKTGER